MTESTLEGMIRFLCRKYGIRVVRPHAKPGDDRGLADLQLYGVRYLERELKSDGGWLRPSQADHARAALAAGVDFSVWRPADWHSGLIDRELRAISTFGALVELREAA